MRDGPWQRLKPELEELAPKEGPGKGGAITREQFIDFALVVFQHEGIRGLLGGRVCRYLGLPKTSFYHRVKGGNEELEHLVLARWHELIAKTISETLAKTSDPAKQLLAVMRMAPDPAETSIRCWATTEKKPRETLSAFDAELLDKVRGMFRQLGHGTAEATFRAQMVLCQRIALPVLFSDGKAETLIRKLWRRLTDA